MKATLTAIIADDEERGRTVIRELLHRYCPQVKVMAECSNAKEAKQAILESNPDMVFLDISMPGDNAFDMLRQLEEIAFEIVFITAHSQYTLDAFRYSALDYLLKPVSEDLLIEAVAKAQHRLDEKKVNRRLETLLYNSSRESVSHGKKICIPGIKGFLVVEVRDIIYLEADSCYTCFHLADGKKITSAKTIGEYEEVLEEPAFFRVHKSFVVNLHYMKEYVKGDGGYIILNNGEKIEVSRRKKEEFLEKVKNLFKL
jgi:two-component system, LytTR family, response regulator